MVDALSFDLRRRQLQARRSTTRRQHNAWTGPLEGDPAVAALDAELALLDAEEARDLSPLPEHLAILRAVLGRGRRVGRPELAALAQAVVALLEERVGALEDEVASAAAATRSATVSVAPTGVPPRQRPDTSVRVAPGARRATAADFYRAARS